MSYTLEKNNYSFIAEKNSIFSALSDPAIIYDVNLNVSKVNSCFIEKFDLNPEGLNIKDLVSLFSCRLLDESKYISSDQPTSRALKGEKTSGVFSIVYAGKEMFFEISSAPIYEDDKIAGALTIWHSLETNEKIRLDLLKRVELHRRIDDLSPIGVIIIRNVCIEYANNAALKILGAKHIKEIEGKTAFDFFNPKFEKLLLRRIENLHSGKIVDEVEQKIYCIDGKQRDVEIMAVNISDSENRILKVYFRDISSQKKIEYFNNILSSIEHVIQSSMNILEITQLAMEKVANAFECDSASVAYLNNSVWEVKHTFGFDNDIKGLIIPRDEEPHAMLALSENKIIFIEDAYTDPRANNERLKGWNIRSVIVVPLFTRHEKIGVIFFNYKDKKVFNHEEIYFLIRFSTSLSLALENSELFDNLQHELTVKKTNEKRLLKLNNILLALSRSSHAMVHATSESEYISEICDIIISDCNQALVWVGFLENNRVVPKIWSGNSGDYVKTIKIKIDNGPFSNGPTGLAIKNKQAFVSNNISEDPGFEPWRKNALQYGLNSSVALPLIHQNQAFGALNIYAKEVDFYTDDEILLLSELAKYLSHGIVSIRLDTAKKQAEESLRESEERFRMITEKSNALICELDANARVLYANAQYLEIFGWKEPFSGCLLDNCKPSDKINFYNYIYKSEQGISKSEWSLKDKNNVFRWFQCHPGIFKTTRGGKHYSLAMFDISESKNSEQQLKKSARELKELNATKDKFFTIIAHDLKNPFTNLIGASELLASDSGFEPETVQGLGKVINDSAWRGFNLLENLLDWSRSQTGTISFDPKSVILIDLVQDCCDNVKQSAYQKGHKFEISIPENIEIIADVNMLTTVIRNLLQNAIKFTHDNGKLKIIAIKNKKEVTVAIEDNGVGISAENLKKLFRIDVKFSNPGTNRETGTGLGLLLCKEFIEKHGGKIWVKSIEGEGSKFFFSIPFSNPYQGN